MTRFVSGHVLAPRFHTLRIALLAALIGIAAGVPLGGYAVAWALLDRPGTQMAAIQQAHEVEYQRAEAQAKHSRLRRKR